MSLDTSVCYEDYASNPNENIAEWPACKKRKIQESIIQENIVKEKSILNNSNECKKSSQNDQQNDNQTHNQKHHEDALALTTLIQSPNLSDSDSNDSFSTTTMIKDKVLVYRILLINM